MSMTLGRQDGSLYTRQQPGVLLSIQVIEVYSPYVFVAVEINGILMMWKCTHTHQQ